MTPPDAAALADLLRALKDQDYQFVTPTMSTHRRVISRPDKASARDLRDVFGWSLPFEPSLIDAPLLALMRRAGIVEARDGRLASTVRVAALGEDLFLHSAFPPDREDAVFFGPNTYRFAGFIAQAGGAASSILDIGTGSGAGAIAAARRFPGAALTLTDVNPLALAFARAALLAAGLEAELVRTRGLDGLEGRFDLVVANPPYMTGSGERLYSDGGDMHGARLSLDWALAAAERLSPGGRVLLYTGSAIVAGEDRLWTRLQADLRGRFRLDRRELDPDVFGGQLSDPAYADVERIAAVGVTICG